MSKYTSEIKVITAAQYAVWNRLSDLSQLQTMKDNLPAEAKAQLKAKLAEETKGQIEITNFSFTADTASFSVKGMPVTVRIVEREEPMKCVKYKPDSSPVDFTIWIQLLPQSPYETKVRVTVEVDIPFYLKPMIGNKLDKAADGIATALTKIPY